MVGSFKLQKACPVKEGNRLEENYDKEPDTESAEVVMILT